MTESDLRHRLAERGATRALLAACACATGLMLALALTACGGAKFEVGDCVTIEQQTLDSELEEATCGDATGSPVDADPIYSVDEVIDGSEGACGNPQGFLPTTFSDEPTDTTYCLSVATP